MNWHKFSTIMFAGVGFFLLYTAFFLREDEQGKVQNSLEAFWIRVDDLSRTSIRRSTVFLVEFAAWADQILNRIYGPELVSFRALAVSFLMMIGSFCFEQLQLNNSVHSMFSERWEFGFLGTFGTIVSILAFAPALVLARHAQKAAFVSQLSATVILLFCLSLWGFGFAGLIITAWCLGFSVIAFNRRLLRWAGASNNLWRLWVALFVNVVLTPLCVATYLLVHFGPAKYLVDPEASERSVSLIQRLLYSNFMMVLSIFNIIPALLCLMIVLLAALLVAHRLSWPILARPVYALARYGVIRNPRLLGSVGVAFLSLAFPDNPWVRMLKDLIK